MKSCLICNSSSDDTASTCTACGEASWSVRPEPAAPQTEDVVTTDDALVEVEQPKGKRSKKQ